MKKAFLLVIAAIAMLAAPAQHKMRSVETLAGAKDPAWPMLKSWIDSAKNKVKVLPVDPTRARDALFKVQLNTGSMLGAVIYNTGGILVDDGWMRILGSGSEKFTRNLPDWNLGKSYTAFGERPPYLLVADDAAGGFFAINGGDFGEDINKVYYLSPDNLEWEPLDLSYPEFLAFCMNGDLASFYSNLRWKGWREEVATLQADSVFNFSPGLWSKEGKNIESNSRKIVPVQEQYDLHISNRNKLGLEEKQ